jgi:murein DD-endopeptidase MepM/ murein hydrolase activator NlpD
VTEPVAFHRVTSGGRRGRDRWGSGSFGASRGGRSHKGVDFVVAPGESVLSPIDGVVVRQLYPYGDDLRFTGLEIHGSGDWAAYRVKLFYVRKVKLGKVKAGDPVGVAQDLEIKYRGMTNHIHVEVRRNGTVVDPSKLFSF